MTRSRGAGVRDRSRGDRRRLRAERLRVRQRRELGAERGEATLHARREQGLGGHDQRVLVVVAVVARPDPDGTEAVLLVEPPCRQVREADLDLSIARSPRDREVQRGREEALADPPPAPRRRHCERRDVRLVDHEPDPGIGDDLVPGPDHEVAGELVRLELGLVGVLGPRCREAGALDLLHGRQVGEGHRLDDEPHGWAGDHVVTTSPPGAPAAPRGSETYSGTTRAGSSARPAAIRAPPSRRSVPGSRSMAASPRATAASGARPTRSTATSTHSTWSSSPSSPVTSRVPATVTR